MPSILVARPIPRGHVPAIVGTVVVAGALPVFLAAGFRVAAWGLAAALWFAGQALTLVLQRLPLGMGSLASSGAVGFGRMFRAVGVMAVLIAVTISDARLGLPAVAVYAFAYSAELGSSLVAYFGGGAGT
jgi:hypothetical protein